MTKLMCKRVNDGGVFLLSEHFIDTFGYFNRGVEVGCVDENFRQRVLRHWPIELNLNLVFIGYDAAEVVTQLSDVGFVPAPSFRHTSLPLGREISHAK